MTDPQKDVQLQEFRMPGITGGLPPWFCAIAFIGAIVTLGWMLGSALAKLQ